MAAGANTNIGVKRKSISPPCNNAFASPRPKKQKTESPAVAPSDSMHFLAEVRASSVQSQQIQVSFSYVYSENAIFLVEHLSQSKSIEVRIPISSFSTFYNAQINRRYLWGGGAENDGCYSADSDIVTMLFHTGILSRYPMDYGNGRFIDPFYLFNQIFAQNTNQTDPPDHMFIRTSTHKMSAEEIESEQKRQSPPDMIGVAVILEVLPPRKRYEGVLLNGLYSRTWINDEDTYSLRVSRIRPLTEYADFVVDGDSVVAMEQVNECTKIMTDLVQKRMAKSDRIGLTFNVENRPCLKYNIRVVGNAHLLVTSDHFAREERRRIERRHRMESDLNLYEDEDLDGDYGMDHALSVSNEEKRYGHLLQWRLQRFDLVMESEKGEQLLLTQKMPKRYALFRRNIGMKQKGNQKIVVDELEWSQLKWSKKGLVVKDTLYGIDKVWLERK